MKASNKILLVIFLTVFGYLAIAQVALHLKYTKGDVINKDQINAFFYDDFKFNDIHHVRLEGVGQCDVILSDSFKLSVEKNNFNSIHFSKTRDTLVVSTENPRTYSADSKLNRAVQKIKLFIRQGTLVSALNSNINIKGNVKKGAGSSYQFLLTGSNLFTRRNFMVDSLPKYFDTLSVQAVDKSQVILFYNDHFEFLSSTLEQSTINDYHAQIEQADIVTDSSSVMVISGGNISKLKATLIKK